MAHTLPNLDAVIDMLQARERDLYGTYIADPTDRNLAVLKEAQRALNVALGIV